MIDMKVATEIAKLLSALGEPTRMMVLELLAEGPKHVSDLAKQIDIPMVNMSHHLGVLKQSGLVADERQGRKKLYSLQPEYFTPSDPSGPSIGQLKFGGWIVTLQERQKKK